MGAAMDIQTVTVRLGDREYQVSEAPRLRSGPWRKRLIAEVKPIFDRVAEAQGMTFDSPADLLRLWPVVEALMVDGLDNLFELLLMYSQTLADDREYIEQHATDKQVLAAFGEVARLADPFGMLSAMSLTAGRSVNGIS